MAKITLTQLEMFCAVVEHGGYVQAAEAINKSQSAVHTSVLNLQNNLGLELLIVEGRKVRITTYGEVILNRAKFILARADDLEAVAQAMYRSDTKP